MSAFADEDGESIDKRLRSVASVATLVLADENGAFTEEVVVLLLCELFCELGCELKLESRERNRRCTSASMSCS